MYENKPARFIYENKWVLIDICKHCKKASFCQYKKDYPLKSCNFWQEKGEKQAKLV